MRDEHVFEKQFKDWKQAGYGSAELDPKQETEVRRAFMGGIFEGLNFLIDRMDDPNAEAEISKAYRFLKAFHEKECLLGQ